MREWCPLVINCDKIGRYGNRGSYQTVHAVDLIDLSRLKSHAPRLTTCRLAFHAFLVLPSGKVLILERDEEAHAVRSKLSTISPRVNVTVIITGGICKQEGICIRIEIMMTFMGAGLVWAVSVC